MKKIVHTKKLFKVFTFFAFLLCFGVNGLKAQTNPTAQNLPYTQNFGTASFSAMPTGMAAWTGGANRTTQAAAEGGTPGADATVTAVTVSQTSGNIYGYAASSNARVYIQESSNPTNGTNTIVAAINSGTATSINVSYQLELINGGVTTQDYGLAIQYRAGTSGSWTTVSGSAITFGAVNTYTTSTLSYAISGLSTSTVYQIRWITWRPTGTGASKGVGIDNISFTAAPSSVSPSITSSLTASANVGTAFNYATIASGTPTSYAATGLPSGLSINTSNGVISGTPSTVGSSNVSLSATNATGTDTKTLVITVGQGTQTITFGALAPITYGATSFSLNGASSSGLQLSYSSSNTAVATILGNTVTIVGAGTTSITASQSGAANYSAAADVSQTLTINKASQIISFVSLSSKLDTDAPFTLGATSTSSLAVTFSSSNSAVISISGTTATIVGAGTASITASQGGDNNYLAATNSTQNQLVVSTALTNQSITFGTLIPVTYGDGTFNLTATGGESGNPVTYSSSDQAIASISGNIVSIIQPGIVTITASQAGNSSYNVAPSVNQTLTINQKILTVSGATATSRAYDATNIATISGATLVGLVGLDIVTVSGGGTFADASPGINKPVTTVLTLNGVDASKYSLTQPTGLTATISQATQTITFASLANKTTADLPFALTASSISGLSITYSSSNTAVATVSGNIVTIVGAGTTTIIASQIGDVNYSAASNVPQNLTVTLAASVIVGWDMNSLTGGTNNFGISPLIPSTSNSNVTNGALIRGSGIVTTGSAAARGWGGLGFNYTTADLAIAANRFAKFSTNVNSGYSMTLSSLNPFGYRVSSTGASSVALQYQINSGSFTTITTFTSLSTSSSGSTFPTIDLTGIAALQNLPSNSVVTFRIVPFGASGATGTFYIYDNANTTSNDLVLNGFVSQLPATSITSSLTANGTVGTSFSYPTIASNSPSSYAATGLPSGLSINTSNGVISGTPSTVGSSNVSLSATNATGTDTKTLVITVGQGTQAITFGALAPITYGDDSFSLNGASSSGLPLSYSSSNTAVATISGNTVTIIGAGTTSITASQIGNDNYLVALDVSQTLTVNKASQTIFFNSLPNKLDTEVPFTLLATSTSSLAVSFSSSNSAVISISGTTATIVGAGTATITASQGGDNNYLAATNSTQNQLVVSTALTNQSITFGTLIPVTYGDGTLNLTATGGESGNPVSYSSSDPTIASISGNVVSIIKPGTVTITASQEGNSSYNTAPSVNQTLTINQKTLTVTGATATSRAYDATNVATITGATLVGVVGLDNVDVIGGGTFADATPEINKTVTPFLTLNGADASKYSLTQPTGLTATISQATQVITFGALLDKTYGDAAFNLVATGGSSSLPIIFSSSDPLVASVLGNTVTIVGVGPVTITASQAGNSNYNSAVDVSQSFTINKANQTITFNALVNRTTADNSFTLGGSASSTLPLSYSSSNAAVATIIGTVVTIVGPGSTTITVSQAGNNLYNAATDVNQTQIVLTAISKWTFEGITTTGSGSNVSVAGSAEANQGLQTSGTLFSANHASASVWSNPAGNGSAKSVSSTFWAVGDYWQFKLNTLNYHTLAIAVDQTGSGTGPSTFKVQYSTNGTSYSDLPGGTYTIDYTGWSTSNYRSAAVRSFDLSSVTTLNNKSEVYVRLVNVNTTSNGSGTIATSGTSRIDNFVITGTACNITAGITNNTNTNVLTCDAATIALTATGGSSYSWSNGTNVLGTSENLSVTAAGTYTVTVSTDNGCTSSASLVINQNTTTSSETQTACDNYTWNGMIYTESGVYTYSSTNTSGCTNIATLNLTINTSSTNTTTTSAVETYSWANNGQTYTVSGVYTGTTINCVTQVLNLIITPSSASLSLQVFLDGYYINSSNPSSMRPARYNNLIESGSTNPGAITDVDVITVELRSAASLNVVAYSVSPILQANGNAQCVFPPAALGGSYYIVVKHRAAIPLWSAIPVTMSASSAFNFANNSTNAFTDGSMTPIHSLISSLYGIWLGELNDDGYLDANDYASFETEVFLSAYSGLYLLDGDFNGDSYVDASDYAVFDYNSTVGVYEQRPY